MKAKKILAFVERYRHLVDSPNGSDDSAKKLLLSEIFDDLSTFSSVEDGDQALLFKMLHRLNPLSAGGNDDIVFIAFCVNMCLNQTNVRNCRLPSDGHPISRVVELVYVSGLKPQNHLSNGDSIDKILKCVDRAITIDRCIHTIVVASSFILKKLDVTSNRQRQSFSRSACELLADAQKCNHRAFTVYLRCFMAWYLEGGSCVGGVTYVFNFFFKSLPDLMPQSFCKETISVLHISVLEHIAIETSTLSNAKIGSIIEKLLCIIPLPLFVDVLAGSFLRSKQSRVRNAGVICIESILVKTYKQLLGEQRINEDEASSHVQQQSYHNQLEKAVKQLKLEKYQEESAACSNEAEGLCSHDKGYQLLNYAQATVSSGIKCVLDAVMQDPNEAVRYRALQVLQRLPADTIRKKEYRILILKCRDIVVKVRATALTIIVELGSKHARKNLKDEELDRTVKYLLQIDQFNPISVIRGGDSFLQEIVNCCLRIDRGPHRRTDNESKQTTELEGSYQILRTDRTGIEVDKRIVTGDTVLRACESLQLHVLPVEKLWKIINHAFKE